MGGEDWRSREKTDLLEKNNVCILWYLETATSFRYWGFLWIRFGGPCVGPCVVILKLYVCVFPQAMFPSYTTEVNCELSNHFSSPLDIVYILPDSFLNSAIPQVWLIFISLKWRWCWEKQPKLLTPYVDKQTGNLWVVPVCLLWTPGLHLLLSHDPQSWSKGVPASTSMPGGTSSSRVPDSF